MISLVDAKRKVCLVCGTVFRDKHLYGAMLKDKHCFKFGGMITCRNTSYYGQKVKQWSLNAG